MDPFSADSEMRSNWRSWSSLTVFEDSLKKLTETQRSALLIVTVILVAIALVGNLATIAFNIRRSIRPLFRSCLISLAITDIITSVFAAITYISQFVDERTVIWALGEHMCKWIPFLTTQAILVNSITLVCIALDRYMAVVKVFKSSWEPKALSCIIGTVVVWAIGAGISSPMLSAYFLVDMTIVETEPHNRSIGIREYHAQICINNKAENAAYYGIVFSSMFLPIFIAFLWLNATIAVEIWNRRNPLDQKMSGQASEGSSNSSGGSSGIANPKRTEGTTSSGTKTTSNMSSSSIKSNRQRQMNENNPVAAPIDDNNNQLPEEQHHQHMNRPPIPIPTEQEEQTAVTRTRKNYQSSNNCRKTRQLRMFKVIIVIMTTFFVCRLPTWIFLLIKLYNELNASGSYLVHFCFGILSLANCAVNPFLYTFLTETIRFGSNIKSRMRGIFCGGEVEGNVNVPEVNPKPISLHKEPLWKSICCCWCEPCGKEELPDDKNLIDHCEYDDKHFRRKSYTLNGKDQLSCISSNVQPPFGHYANVYLGTIATPLPIIPITPDPNIFVDVDLMNRK